MRLAVTAAIVAGSILLWWRREEGTVVAALGLVPVAAAGLVWAAGEPIFNERNMLPVAPFLAILVAAGVKALPARLVPAVAAFGIVAALGGAAYAGATLGRVPYDSAARALTGVGWTSRDALIVDYPTVTANRRGVGIQITSAAAWYLPGRPLLLWAPGRRGCRTRFAIVQTPNARAWLARAGDQVTGARVLAYYDHPILGRRHGSVVVVRFRRPTRLPGAFYYALGSSVRCRR
jgi:hypothetical protein